MITVHSFPLASDFHILVPIYIPIPTHEAGVEAAAPQARNLAI